MSDSNINRLSEHMRRMKFVFARLLVICILLVGIYSHPLEKSFTELLSLAVGPIAAEYLYLLLFVPLGILVAYFASRIYVDLSSFIISLSLSKLKVRSSSPIFLLNKILGFGLLIITAIWILSSKFPFLTQYVEAVMASFSGLFSLLVTLVVAMQMKEIGGNFIAGIILRASDVVNEGEYVRLDNEYVRIEKIGSTYTNAVNILDERIFIPNLKFLTDNFRKPYSKQNLEYVDLRFSVSYEYPMKQVEQDVSGLVNQYNQTPNLNVKIKDFTVVTIDLAAYSVIYELRLKPSAPIFPEAIRSDFRRLLHEKYGEDLATPMMLNIRK